MSRGRALLYYAAHAALAVFVLAQAPAIRSFPLRVPITYRQDGLFLTVLAKTIREDGFLHATRIGAPFGTELADWPIGMWLPFASMAGLTALTGEPGAAINLYWISTIVLAGLCAAYAFRRLRLPAALAFVLGMLYAFQPFVFYRNVEHVNLTFPFVPLLALLLLRVSGTRPEDESRGERALTLAACVAQGLSYIYFSAFACLLLAAAAPVGWLRTRSLRPVRRAALALALLVACSAATVAPTLGYWKRHGYNPDLDYKPPAETEQFALKLRHLLTPISDHPLAPFRYVARKLESAGFAGDNENALSRLGTFGSLGFLALVGFLLGRAAGLLPRRDEPLDGAATLTLATLLWSTVGGFATFFSVFVLSDIRAYGRMVVFLSFFCLLAFGTLVTRAAARLPLPGRLRAPAAWAALALLLASGLKDEIPQDHLWNLRKDTAAAFDEERQLVREIESRLPAGAMVFQLPHMTVPVDRATYPPMLYYDPGRAYVHSRTLRWGWGAMIGRRRDWGRAVEALPPPDAVRVLALAGFSGIWIDRWGYTGKERPRYEEIEKELTSLTGESPLVSTQGRYSLLSLEPYRQRLEARLGPRRLARLRGEQLADMPIVRWTDGCGDDEAMSEDGWRPCGRLGTLAIRNWRPGAIAVHLRALFRPSAGAGVVAVSGPGFEERVALRGGITPYERWFEVQGRKQAAVTLRFDASLPCAGPDGSRCLEVGEPRLVTYRLIRGKPVNEDGGVAVRTKY